MPDTRQFSVILPSEMAEQVERKVESGAYSSVSEVVREGVELLLDHELPLEKWLREEVLESIKEYKEDPTSVIPSDQIIERVRATAHEMRAIRRRRKGES